jgi:LmbE family N-acetylglucosaminyl deacetylase
MTSRVPGARAYYGCRTLRTSRDRAGDPPFRWTATALDAPVWRGDIAVVSPHLDDAVLSLGASMRAAARRGADVTVITVHAGDPASEKPADAGHRAMGFSTAAEAARTRRAEDERACRALGVRPVWLDVAPLAAIPDEAVERLRLELADRDAVLVPAFPLTHLDHVSVGRAVLEVLAPEQRVGLYVEQPYAAWNSLSRSFGPRVEPDAALRRLQLAISPGARWARGSAGPGDWMAKLWASGAYHSQLLVLRRAPRPRILLYEAAHGGERVLWCRLDGLVRP